MATLLGKTADSANPGVIVSARPLIPLGVGRRNSRRASKVIVGRNSIGTATIEKMRAEKRAQLLDSEGRMLNLAEQPNYLLLTEKDLESEKGRGHRWKAAKCLAGRFHFVFIACMVAIFVINIVA